VYGGAIRGWSWLVLRRPVSVRPVVTLHIAFLSAAVGCYTWALMNTGWPKS